MLAMLLSVMLVAAPAVSIKVTPQVGASPLTMWVEIRVHVDNVRQVCIEMDGTHYNASCWPYNLKTTNVRYRDMPEGEYIVIGVIQLKDGSVKRSAPVTVLIN
jgi:hypothetical protein